jgi:hypothetical protein
MPGRWNFVILFQLHIALMAVGSAMIAAAVLVAATQRGKRWWLRVHRGIGLSGTVLILAGAAAVVAATAVSGGSHFRTPHTWFGALTNIMAVTTPLLGFMSFRMPKQSARLRFWHRFAGRILAGMILITILLGLYAAGFL